MKSLFDKISNKWLGAMLLFVFVFMFWPKSCLHGMGTQVHFRGVRDCPSATEINNPAWYDTPLFNLKL